MNMAIPIALALTLAVTSFAQDKPDSHVTATTPSTQPASAGEPTTQPTQQLQDEIDRLRAKSALAREALDRARAAALHRFSQTLEYQQGEAAVADAQKELDGADSVDARATAATDMLKARIRLDRLQENALASDVAVTDATKSDAEASAQLKLAEARLAKAQADEAAAAKAAAAAAETTAAAANSPATRPSRWQEDLDYFARELPVRQKDFYMLMPQDRFEREVAELQRQAPQLSDPEIVFELMRIVASLGVAHTEVHFGSATETMALHSYPVQLQWFSDGLAVVAAASEYQRAIGSRVVRIGSKTPEQVEAAVAPYIAHENDAHLHVESPRYMTLVELMQHEKISDPTGRLRLTCAEAGGGEFTLEIASEGSAKAGRNWMTAAEALHIPKELCRKHPRAFYWDEYLPETDTLYIQYNRCADAPGNPFEDFANKLFAFADAHPVQRVVLDLRFNGGGITRIVDPLVDGLKSRPALNAKGDLYVLIAGRTFSAAMDTAMNFRKHLNAILVGEPAGNKPNHYGQASTFTLPNSKLQVQYSTEYVRQIRDADPLSLDPDILVPYSVNDFLAGRDPALEVALHPGPPASTTMPSSITNGAEWEDGKPVALPGVRRPKVESVFLSRPGTEWRYSHHPHLGFFKGRFYAIWSNGRETEDRPGQRVLISTAEDFTHWTQPRPLVDTVKDAAGVEQVLTAVGLYPYGGTLVAYVASFGPHKENRLVETLTTTDGQTWSPPHDIGIPLCPNHGPQPTSSGRLIICANTSYPWSDDPSGLGGWHMAGIDSQTAQTLQGDPCEGAFYQTDDGVIHMLLRNGTSQIPHRLWLTESRDNGLTWSAPAPTEFSDAYSKFHFGRLPDGRFYYVGNPLWRRTPLVLSLSRDGVRFDQHFILAEAHRDMPRESDEYGYPAYPHSIVHDGRLYVIVSRDKSKIQVLRVALSDL
ncbi:MAG: exo-alpha-sialidase [Tepidisphaeraceae bacterium]